MEPNSGKGDLKMTTKVQKWGNSLGVRIPGSIAQDFGLRDGSQIEVSKSEQGIVIKPVKKKPTLEELLEKCTPDNRHEEQFDFGPVGKELI